MTVLNQTQIDLLQGLLSAHDIAGFYSTLYGWGDPYGRLGEAVSDNSTWQGEMANLFLTSASGESVIFGNAAWHSINENLAQGYLDLYTSSSNPMKSLIRSCNGHP